MNPRWAVPLAANALLVFLGGQVNHHLATFPLSVLLAGLCLPAAGLRLRFGQGLIVAFATGLMLDAQRPVPFGANALLLAALFTAWYSARARLPREGLPPVVIGALLANFVLFAAQPLFAGPGPALGAATAGRILWDLACSQAAVAALAPWFLALQETTLSLWGINLADEGREPGGVL